MFFIDDFSRMTWVSFLKYKSEILEALKIFKETLENELCMNIKGLRIGKEEEHISNYFSTFCETYGIEK